MARRSRSALAPGWTAPCNWFLFLSPFLFYLAAVLFSCGCSSCGCGCATFWAKLVKPACLYPWTCCCAYLIYFLILVVYWKLGRAIDTMWANINFSCCDRVMYYAVLFLNFLWYVSICYCHHLEPAIYFGLGSWIMSFILMMKIFEINRCQGFNFLWYQAFATYIVVLTSALWILNPKYT